MAITFVNSTTGNWGAVAAPQSINVPTGTTTGDVVLVFGFQYNETPAMAAPTSNGQAFTELCEAQGTAGTSDYFHIGWYRVWTGAEDTTIDVATWDDAAVGHSLCALTFRGVDSSVLDVALPSHSLGTDSTYHDHTEGTTSSTMNCPAVTTVTNGAWVIQASGFTGSGITAISSDQTGSTEGAEIIAGRANQLVTYEEQATAGSYAAATHTYDTDTTAESGAGLTLVLKPEIAVTITATFADNYGAAQAGLSAIQWAWFDEDIGALNAPTAQGSVEVTDLSGAFSVDVTGTALTGGQTGTLVLYDSSGGKYAAYRAIIGSNGTLRFANPGIGGSFYFDAQTGVIGITSTPPMGPWR